MILLQTVAISCLCLSVDGYFLRGKTAKAPRRPRQEMYVQNSEDSSSTTSQDESSSAFGTSLFLELCKEVPEGSNVLFSPFSVHQALVLVKDGATPDSENEYEMERLLGPQAVQDEANLLQEQSQANDPDSDVQLTMATSIWADNLTQSYVDTAKETHSADALPLPARYTAVDEWIEDKTEGMITDLMGNEVLDPLTVALLVNAVHFKGTWTYEFDPAETVNGTFALGDGTDVAASYMTARRNMEVIRPSPSLGGASVLVLDYGEQAAESDAEFSSIFILPSVSDPDPMKSVLPGLTSQSISDLLQDTYTTDVRLELPRFRLEFGPSELKNPLMRMGMNVAFDKFIPNKFLLMSDDPDLYVNDVFHGASMEVTEVGTEAAAASVVEIRTRSAPRTFGMKFDRPFVVVVLHRPSGIPLFMGKIERPDFFF